jgi:putative transposase
VEILKASGIGPARQSGPRWSQFLRSQAEAILACDFFTADLLDGTQAYVLAGRCLERPEVCVGGCRWAG